MGRRLTFEGSKVFGLVRSLVLLVSLAAIGRGQTAAGWFESTGSLVQARSGHSATLLNDGRVLIVGGRSSDFSSDLASAEIYEPGSGKFRSTGSLQFPRSFHQAVLLDDGKVLIAGYGGPQLEIYDPATEQFQKVGDAAGDYGFGSAASKLPDGRVAFIGRDLEIFDPKTLHSQWLGRIDSNTGIALKDGRILALSHDAARSTDLVRVFEIESGSPKETLVLSLGSEWFGRTLTELGNGDILIAGGAWDYGELTGAAASVFELHSSTLRGVNLMLFARSEFPVTRMPDGRVLMVGGYSGSGYSLGVPGITESEVYDPTDGSFVFGGNETPFGRNSHTATLLQNGRVLIAGGVGSTALWSAARTASLFTPEPRVVSAASRRQEISPGSLVSLFGANLASRTETASGSALPTTLGGVSVRVRDRSGTERLARLLYVSPTQVNFELPAEMALGAVTIRTSGAPSEVTTTGQAAAVAPALFTRNGDDIAAYATRVEPNGARALLPVGEPLVLDDRPMFLSIYGTGIRGRSALSNVQVQFGGLAVPADYAGPSGDGIPGLDQVNVRIPESLRGSGLVDVTCVVDGVRSNVGRLIVK